MNTYNNNSTLLNNSFTSNIQQNNENKICNAFGCFNTATVKVVLPVGSKSIKIFVCENCAPKFEDNYDI